MASAGNIMQRQRYTDLFASRLAYIDEILFENFDAPSLTYPQVFNVRNSSRAYEEMTGLTGFGQFSQKAEGSAVDYDTILQAYDKRFTHLTYAKGYQITTEAMDDDLDGAITNAAPALARAARVSIETYIWNLFNLGFTTETTPDGVALFSASHPLVGGGTYSNIVSGDLSQANIETAINLFDNMVDDRGLPIEASFSNLVIPVELRWIAYELLQSQLRPDTANNTVNALNQISLNVVMSKYLTGDDDWFITSAPSEHRCLVYWRQEPVTDHTMDFDTGNMKSKMTYRLSRGASDWRNVIGGQGA
jgi:phage major head subunit gpT-like protein